MFEFFAFKILITMAYDLLISKVNNLINTNQKNNRMKTFLAIAAMALGLANVQAQNNCETPQLKEGDVIKIASPSHATYSHINFPKSNFIIKRGGIANHKSLINKEIEVTEVKMENGCIAQIEVKLKDGKKFFNVVREVSIDLKDALASGEIEML